MKHVVFIIMGLLALTCCNNSEKNIDPIFRWKPIVAKADSLIICLEKSFIYMNSADSLIDCVEKLEEAAKNNHNHRQLMSRAYFWKARINNRMHNNDKANENIGIAKELCDSATYTYDWMRICYLASIIEDIPNASYYSRLKSFETFARKTHDDFMLASILIDQGHLLYEYGFMEKALDNYIISDSLYLHLGITPYHLKTGLNNAAVLMESGQKEKSRRICLDLLNNREAKKDSDFYNALRLTAFMSLEDTSLLLKGYPEVKRKNDSSRLRLKYDIAIGTMYLDSCLPYKALNHIKVLIPAAHGIKSCDIRECIWAMAYRVYKDIGMRDSAYKYLEMTSWERDSLLQEEASTKIASIENQSEILRIEQSSDQKRRKDRLLTMIYLFMLIILSLIAIIFLMKKNHKSRLRLLETQLSLEVNQRKAVTSSLAIREKDSMLENILNQMNEIGYDKEENIRKIHNLQNDIRLHLSGRQEWEDFQKVFEKVHPSFSVSLKQKWPLLSEGDIRLATYIRIGLSSKQIARMLLLQPDSVKKNRQRMRKRMKLSAEISLEDAIRSI